MKQKEKVLVLITVKEGGADFEDITSATIVDLKKRRQEWADEHHEFCVCSTCVKIRLFEGSQIGEEVNPGHAQGWLFTVGYVVNKIADTEF